MGDNQQQFRSLQYTDFSIITCFNDRSILEGNLLSSTNQQREAAFELICVDNTQGKFQSVTSALNYGSRVAKGTYLMFAHQDVYLCGSYWLRNSLSILSKLAEKGAAGVAGVDSNSKCAGFIVDRGRLWGRPFKEPISVQTLDEQLIITPRKVFEKVKFDEHFRFHSYVVDYCLTLQKLGLKVYVLPALVEHNSLAVATLSASDLKKEDALLYKKHGKSFVTIYKTTGTLGRKSGNLRKTVFLLSTVLLFSMTSAILRLWGVTLNRKIILDIGCIPFEQHDLKKYLTLKIFSIGVSKKRRYLVTSKRLNVHEDYIVADPEKLPFRPKSIDVTFLTGILEYLSKDRGKRILKMTEEISKELLVKVPLSGSPIDTTHSVFGSFWETIDFKENGYKTFSIGLKQPVVPSILFAYKGRWKS